MLDFLSLSVHIFSCFLLWIQLVIWTLSILGKLSPINFFTGLIVLWSFACCKKILEPIDKVHSFILCTLTSSSLEGIAALVSPICYFFFFFGLVHPPGHQPVILPTTQHGSAIKPKGHWLTWIFLQFIFFFSPSYSLASSFWLCLLY